MSYFPATIDWHWIWLSVAAFLAGVLNAVAGGGSFLLFPAMLGMKMLPVQANATNTVALWPGQLTSVAAYREDIRKNRRLAWPMGLAGLIGGTAGALVLLNTPQSTFLHLVPWLLLVAALIFAASGPVIQLVRAPSRQSQCSPPRRRILCPSSSPPSLSASTSATSAPAQASSSSPLLSLFGFQDLNEINALKVVSTTMANGIAFLIFVISGQVEWRYCLLAMVTCAIGGYSSARLARKIPQPVLRATVVAIGLGMAAWFFWKNPS